MRRYHNWLDSLPDKERDDLQVRPPGERMAQIKKMLSRFPLPAEGTPLWLQFADFAGPSPFETATTFRIWQGLTTQQRHEIEALTAPGERRMKLMAHGRELRLLREIRPADFSIDEWIPRVEAKLAEIQPLDPEIRAALTKAESTFKTKYEGKAKVREHSPLMRRLAINLYLLEQPPPSPVDSQHLAQFLAAMPPWLRTSFDVYPADEARRRLTVVYRLLFPRDEFKPVVAKAKTGVASSTAPKHNTAPPPPAPVTSGKAPAVPKVPSATNPSDF